MPLFPSEPGDNREESGANLERIILASRPWAELESAVSSGIFPQSVVFFSPGYLHVPFIHLYAELLFSGGKQGSESTRGWSGGNHPDLLVLGEPGSPPGIDECRGLLPELSTTPVSAPVRLAAVNAAHRLSPPAANSLLKITEEPPPRGRLLLLLEEETLLPTLRSRSWCLRLPLEDFVRAVQPPSDDSSWLEWLRVSSTQKVEEILLNAASWARWYALQGKFQKAADLDSFVALAQKSRISTSMATDLLFLMTREEVSLENFFDSLR
jgi:DNA polymerase-3 subunit delta'